MMEGSSSSVELANQTNSQDRNSESDRTRLTTTSDDDNGLGPRMRTSMFDRAQTDSFNWTYAPGMEGEDCLLVELDHCLDLPKVFRSAPNPYVCFTIQGGHGRPTMSKASHRRANSSNPTWDPPDKIIFPMKDVDIGKDTIVVEVYSWSESAMKFMRCCLPCLGMNNKGRLLGVGTLKLKELQDAANFKKEYTITLHDLETNDALPSSITASVTITTAAVAAANHVTDLDVWQFQRVKAGDFRHENLSSVFGDPNQWGCLRLGTESTIDRSFNDFNAATPPIPAHTKAEDWGKWHFKTGKGTTDPVGWQYAVSFSGPWHPQKEFSSLVRRRKWVKDFTGDHAAYGKVLAATYRQSEALQTDPTPKSTLEVDGRGEVAEDNPSDGELDDVDEFPT